MRIPIWPINITSPKNASVVKTARIPPTDETKIVTRNIIKSKWFNSIGIKVLKARAGA